MMETLLMEMVALPSANGNAVTVTRLVPKSAIWELTMLMPPTLARQTVCFPPVEMDMLISMRNVIMLLEETLLPPAVLTAKTPGVVTESKIPERNVIEVSQEIQTSRLEDVQPDVQVTNVGMLLEQTLVI
jgi:hypothetical protein